MFSSLSLNGSSSIRSFHQDASKRLGRVYRSLSKELSRLGIQHRVTWPHTSEQNRVAGRRHRQIVEMRLTLLAYASMPLEFWSFRFAHTVYLINRLPTPILHQANSYEKLYKLHHVYSHLKVFSCAYFLHLRPFHQHKLHFRSEKCVFLGVGTNQKGNKCLFGDGRIFVSRHVVFD